MSNGNFYVGKGGFAYKRKGGGGTHRIFSLSSITNAPCDVFNKYVPGSGVGASSISNRRAKNLHSTICSGDYPCYKNFSRLGLYVKNNNNNYASNWYIPQPIQSMPLSKLQQMQL
jgi:hypothetical protein